jgi:uncharacterized protein (TIGR02266 family)
MLIDRSFSELFSGPQTSSRRSEAERRGHARIPIHTEVMVATDEQFFSALSADLSEEGIFLLTHRVLPIGQRVSVEFTLPKGDVVARGSVRWVRKAADEKLPGLAIGFDDLRGADRALVRAFCGGRPRFYTYDEIRAESDKH